MNKFFYYLNKLYVTLVVGILLFLVGIWVGQRVDLASVKIGKNGLPTIATINRQSPPNVSVDFTQFWKVWDRLRENYLNKKDITEQKLLYGAIGGLVSSLGDPYSVFLDPSENESFNGQLSGTYEGVGIELGSKEGKLVVVTPLDDSPAAKAGIMAQDIVVQIDGKDTTQLTVPGAVQIIRGKAGTSISLSVVREGKNLDFKLQRAKITVKSVVFTDMGLGVARIKISQFGDNTKSEWNSAVNKFVSGGFSKMILDLRNDPGGRLDSAVYILGDFVDKGTSVVQEESSNGVRRQLRSENEPRLKSITPVILINGGSASAAEIVAGGLRDLKGSKLVGVKSFGKGTVQEVDSLDNGAGLHLTIAKWLTPKGTWVNSTEGLLVDVEVKMSTQDLESDKDPQFDKALELVK